MDIDDAETFGGYRKFGAYGLSGAGNGRGGIGVDTGITSAAVGSPSLSDTGTYLMIAKFTGINQAAGVARAGTWWALSTSDTYELRGHRPPISNAFQNYDFDEIFSGTSLADLGLPQVPEPSSAAVLLLGAPCSG
jgi:hypothetical protein